MVSPHDRAEHEPARANWSQLLMWLVACVIATGALSLLAVNAPQRVKLLGLFAIGLGALSGWIIAYFSQMFGILHRKVVAGFAFVLVVTAQAGMAVEAHRLYADEVKRVRAEDESSRKAALLFNQAPPPEDPEALKQWRSMRAQVEPTFRAYLVHRVSTLGEWPAPWPALFWLAELLAAGLAGAAVAYASTRPSAAGRASATIQNDPL